MSDTGCYLARYNEKELIRSMQLGDQKAFAAVINRHQRAVRLFATLYGPSRIEAEDIAQEVFLIALQNIIQYNESQGDFRSWLIGIARNLVRQSWKRLHRHSREITVEIALSQLEQCATKVYTDNLENLEDRIAALELCIRELPERSKALFTAYVVDEYSSVELAAALGTSDGTVRTWISRLRRTLRECVDRRTRRGAHG